MLHEEDGVETVRLVEFTNADQEDGGGVEEFLAADVCEQGRFSGYVVQGGGGGGRGGGLGKGLLVTEGARGHELGEHLEGAGSSQTGEGRTPVRGDQRRGMGRRGEDMGGQGVGIRSPNRRFFHLGKFLNRIRPLRRHPSSRRRVATVPRPVVPAHVPPFPVPTDVVARGGGGGSRTTTTTTTTTFGGEVVGGRERGDVAAEDVKGGGGEGAF